MIKFTSRLDNAIRIAATAHKNQNRKGSETPYIVHPYGVMIIASDVTDDEDTLISCLFHDIIEDIPEQYSQEKMRQDFGQNVVNIVLDVTKNDEIKDWRERSNAYLDHIANKAREEALIVCAADKIHNLQSVLTDYQERGDKLWQIFATNSASDQLWWYESVLSVLESRNTPKVLTEHLGSLIDELKGLLN